MFAVPRNLLFSIGLPSAENTFYQLGPDELVQQCVERNQGVLSDTGALGINTGELTAGSPNDCFIVKDKITASAIDWNEINQPIEEKYFDALFSKMIDHLRKKEIWIRDAYACAEKDYKVDIRIINEDPASNLFVYNMFLTPAKKELESFNPDWYVIHAPSFFADPSVDGTREGNFTMINFSKRVILIGGSADASEIKKAIFSILNFLSPNDQNLLSIRCSANKDETAGN